MKFKLPIPWAIIKMMVRVFLPEPWESLVLSLIEYVENLPDGPKKDELKGELAKAAMKTKEDGNPAHFKSALDKCYGRCEVDLK